MIASCTALDSLLILTWREKVTMAEHVHSYTVPAAVLLELPLTTTHPLDSLPSHVPLYPGTTWALSLMPRRSWGTREES